MHADFSLVLIMGVGLAGTAVYMIQTHVRHTQIELAREREIRTKTGPLAQIFAVNRVMKYGDIPTPEDVQMIFVQESAPPNTPS